jgi:hypothetical protein
MCFMPETIHAGTRAGLPAPNSNGFEYLQKQKERSMHDDASIVNDIAGLDQLLLDSTLPGIDEDAPPSQIETVLRSIARAIADAVSRQAGIDPKLVADQLGHGLGVRLDVYTVATLDKRQEAVQTLEAALGGGSPSPGAE